MNINRLNAKNKNINLHNKLYVIYLQSTKEEKK
jgi:hypothetical protein